MRLELSRYIESDLEAIAEFIAEDNPRRALSFIRDIKQKIDRIAEQPFALSAPARDRRGCAARCR